MAVHEEFLSILPSDLSCTEAAVSTRFVPVTRVGVYIPSGLPSSLITYLAAIKAAKVRDPLIYIGQNEAGSLDPLTLYVAKKFGVSVIGGPARLAFPLLAYGGLGIEGCDLISGPCGYNLNVLKHVSALMAGCVADMHAGPSNIVVILEGNDYQRQAIDDLLSQLEHGPDSSGIIVVIGNKGKNVLSDSELSQFPNARVRYATDVDNAVNIANQIAPEILSIYSKRSQDISKLIINAGVIYLNQPSALGDYGAIGRGCADPTGRAVKGQSGLSPLTFMRAIPTVHPHIPTSELIECALSLASYEGMSRHYRSIGCGYTNITSGGQSFRNN